jgi:hypothetical protein
MNQDTLKELLREIRWNDYKPPLSPTIDQLLPIFLDNIGNPDGELRDQLVFDILSEWIYQGVYDQSQILEIVSILLDENHLFSGIGTKDNDSLFTRSFSALQLWAVLYTENKKHFLPSNTILEIANNLLILFEKEKDFRAYVDQKGWGHCIAHLADCIVQMIKLPQLDNHWHEKFMKAIIFKVLEPDFIYQGDESERLAAPAAEIITGRSIIQSGLDQLFEALINTRNRDGIYAQQFFKFVNARDFLRGIYFALRKNNAPQDQVSWVDKKLLEISQRP